MTHYTTLVQRCRSTNSLLADDIAAEFRRIERSHDDNMERLKACEHIADGDEGWEKLAQLCPSTAAVARLRAALGRIITEYGDTDIGDDAYAIASVALQPPT